LASQYGLAKQVKVNDDCKIEGTTIFALSGLDVRSDWVYNVNHIKNIIIKGYERQLEELDAGKFEIAGITKEGSKEYLETLKKNWEKVIDFHQRETLPHYNLCDPNTVNDLDLPEAVRKRLEKVRDESFCNEIGSYSVNKDTFKLKDFVWTQDKINAYNKLREVFRGIEK
jgi:hypothetical protein